MPAENIIAIQETVRNSGSSSSRPSGMLPYWLIASQITNTTKALAVGTNSQPALVIVQSRRVPETRAERVGADEAPDQERDRDRGRDAEDDLVEATWTRSAGSATASSAGCGVRVVGVRPWGVLVVNVVRVSSRGISGASGAASWISECGKSDRAGYPGMETR